MKVNCAHVLCFLFITLVYIFSLISLVLLVIVSMMYCAWLLFPFSIIIGSICHRTVCKDRLSERDHFDEYRISTISNSIIEPQIDVIDSQVNTNQLNQCTEPPPLYEIIAIELPSYDEAVKHENSNGISSNEISFNEISSNGIPIQKA